MSVLLGNYEKPMLCVGARQTCTRVENSSVRWEAVYLDAHSDITQGKK